MVEVNHYLTPVETATMKRNWPIVTPKILNCLIKKNFIENYV